jgi:oxygen-independent coproporphyrinogen-3 oxidase
MASPSTEPQVSSHSLNLMPARPSYAPIPDETTGAGASIDALYVHVPFCTTKCHYCDFYSLAGHLEEAEPFLAAIEREAAIQADHFGRISPTTIFIGGGTPTLLDAARLARLLDTIRRHVTFDNLTEFTVEANPNTFDAARARVLVEHGVNRISFGAQSFIATELRTLQRDHDPENVAKAFELARHAGIDNLNVDLIFGIPGQNLQTWAYSLECALALGAQHMSCYSLTYEPNTAMTARMKRGEFAVMDEDLELAMFDHVYARMRAANFERYEVSNYARTGKQCLHNVHYWKGANWAAWGPSAAAHVNGWRWKNVGSLAHYLDAFTGDHPLLPLTQMEHLTKTQWAGEVAAFWLRLSEGMAYAEFERRTSVAPRQVLERVLQPYVEGGFVTLTNEHATLTERAVPVSNRILREVVGAFDLLP